MSIKVQKKHADAILPTKAHADDAGYDLYPYSFEVDEYGCLCIGLGVGIAIPKGYVGLLFPRSSNCKKELTMGNSVGVIDSGYTGEVIAKFRPSLSFNPKDSGCSDLRIKYKREVTDEMQWNFGKPCVQLVIVPILNDEIEEVDTLGVTDRGNDGYGSTDK